MKLVQLLKAILHYLSKNHIVFDPTIMLKGIFTQKYSQCKKTRYLLQQCLITKDGKQTKCPSMRLIKNIFVHPMEYYAAVKKNEVTINKLIWGKYLDIQVSEKKQSTQ